jgi:AcrR family transcriptional regulator
MSPRPRKVSDDDVFLAALRTMGRLGPHELTLAAIAEEAGVTAGALVQRFGSRRALLLALAARAAEGCDEMFRAIRVRHATPLAALAAYVEGMSGLASTPEALARNLAYLQTDLTDPDLRAHQVRQGKAVRRQLEAWLDEAVAEGEVLAGTNTRRLARLVEAMISGSMMTWACYQEGTARGWMRRHLADLLAPYCPQRRPGVGRNITR